MWWGYHEDTMWEHSKPYLLPKNLSKLFALTGSGVTKPRSRSSHLMKLLLSNFFENCCFLFQKRVDLLQLMINAHNEARNDDTEHDQEFHDVHGGTERKGISVFEISTSVIRSVRPRLVGLKGF